MGRAIVRRPCAFLMDEPLSNLDAKLRVQLRTEIRRLHERLAVTFCYVTHDQTEALTIGDRVAVLRRGRLQQLDDPQRLYDAPANLFVAGGIGSPPTNLLHAPVETVDGERVARAGPWTIPLPSVAASTDSNLVVGIRPEHLEEPRFAAGFGRAVTAEVAIDVVEPLGGATLAHFSVDARPVTVRDDAPAGERGGELARALLRAPVEAHRSEIKAIVARHKGTSVAIFGSVGRGDETADSDIDFLVQFGEGASLFDLVRTEMELGELLAHRVDVSSVGGLLPEDDDVRKAAVSL